VEALPEDGHPASAVLLPEHPDDALPGREVLKEASSDSKGPLSFTHNGIWWLQLTGRLKPKREAGQRRGPSTGSSHLGVIRREAGSTVLAARRREGRAEVPGGQRGTPWEEPRIPAR